MTQSYFWEAVYKDGTALSEKEANSFYDIKQEELKRFYLKGPTIVEVCMETGRIYIGGHLFDLPQITKYYDREVRYELIQFKRARIQFGETTHRILSYNVGWKNTKGNEHIQAIVILKPGQAPLIEIKETNLLKQESKISNFIIKQVENGVLRAEEVCN